MCKICHEFFSWRSIFYWKKSICIFHCLRIDWNASFYLTQKQLGELVGVQKAQISRLESNASNVTMDTLMKVFSALKAKVKLQIELPNAKFNLAGNLWKILFVNGQKPSARRICRVGASRVRSTDSPKEPDPLCDRIKDVPSSLLSSKFLQFSLFCALDFLYLQIKERTHADI